MATIITSEETIPINEPFKVTAGPGAGKIATNLMW